VAGGGLRPAGEHAQQRALSSARGTEDAVDLAGGHRQIDAREGALGTEVALERAHRDRMTAHPSDDAPTSGPFTRPKVQ
jgi:hypothetical protein